LLFCDRKIQNTYYVVIAGVLYTFIKLYCKWKRLAK